MKDLDYMPSNRPPESNAGAAQGPRIEHPKKPVTILNLAQLNRYGSVTQTLQMLIANGELADYDDELANRVKDAIEIVEGVCTLARLEGWKSYEDELMADTNT